VVFIYDITPIFQFIERDRDRIDNQMLKKKYAKKSSTLQFESIRYQSSTPQVINNFVINNGNSFINNRVEGLEA
jgi:hypothetical protein